jgi:hypothetical protein
MVTVSDIEDTISEYLEDTYKLSKKQRKAIAVGKYGDKFSKDISGGDIIAGSDLWDYLLEAHWDEADRHIDDNIGYGSKISINDFHTMITEAYVVHCDKCNDAMCVIPSENIDDTCHAYGEFNGRPFDLTLCQDCYDEISSFL